MSEPAKNPHCPVTRDKVRRLRAVAVLACEGEAIVRFDGDAGSIETAARRYPATPATVWKYETRGGSVNPWPRMSGDTGTQDPHEASADRALYLAERFSEMNAKAYREAYNQCGQLMGGALTSLTDCLTAMSNRLTMLEETLGEEQRKNIERSSAVVAQGADDAVVKLLDLAIKRAEAKTAQETATAAAAAAKAKETNGQAPAQ